MNAYDIIIIGAGIAGLAIARRLARYNLSICVIEKEADVAMGATKANSAIVHGGFAENHNKLKGRLCYPGRRQFAGLADELAFSFKPIGSLVITTDPADLPKLEALLENGRLNGLPDLSILNREHLLALEPNLNPNVCYALHCAGAGICSPYEMAIALAENAVANGTGLLLDEEVTGITGAAGYFTVTTDKRRLRGKYVINCAGLMSAGISEMILPKTFTITPRTGEYLLFAKGTGRLMQTVVFQMPTQMGKGILVTPTCHDNLLLGPDAIDEPGKADRATHVERLAAILKQGRLTTEKLDATKYIRSFTGIRAVSSTDDFIIEMSPARGFIQVAGIQSPGLTSSPAIAEQVVEILRDDGLALTSKADYQPRRKPNLQVAEMKSMQDAARLASLPAGPERLICRCEQVSEKMITDCLHRGIPVMTIDGVKRRTRASMGICQGNFCKPRIKELIEREYGVTIDGQTDIERAGVTRVTRQEFLNYLQHSK